MHLPWKTIRHRVTGAYIGPNAVDRDGVLDRSGPPDWQ